MNARSRASPGLGRYQPGRSTTSGSIFSMSMTSASSGRSQVARLTAAEHQHAHVELARRLEVARVGDDVRYRAQPGRGHQVGVGWHQHRDRAEARERGDRDQRAGPGLHQHADVRALPHADLDQAADDVVDAAVHRLVGVHAAVEQQGLPVGQVAGLLGHEPAERDPGVVVDLAEPGKPGQGAIGLDNQRARRLVGGDERVGGRAGQAEDHLGGGGGAVGHPRAQRDTAFAALLGLQRHRRDAVGHVPGAVDPLDPLGDRGPGLRRRLRADDQSEMPCADEEFVDIGLRCGTLDPAHRGRLTDVVDLADDGQHRAVDVRQA